MPFSILGLSTAVPQHTMSAAQAMAMSRDCVCRSDRQARILQTVFRRSRIENRHLCVPYTTAYQWVPVSPQKLTTEEAEASHGPSTAERMRLYAEHAAPLAIRAVKSALDSSGVAAREISHLVTVSCTGFEAPGVDVALIDQLKLPETVERIHVGFMGCHGAINGMRAVSGLVSADPHARVLLCATELCSLHFCFSWDPERILGNALFADGSAALVCGPDSQEADGPWRVTATGSCLIRDSRDAITWRLGDHGFEMSLSNRVPEIIQEHLRPWLLAWLDRHNLAIEEIGSWAVHPGGPKIVEAVEQALDLPASATEVSRQVLREHGNMSSPTVLFILARLQAENAQRPCVALGFGPGLIAEAALIR